MGRVRVIVHNVASLDGKLASAPGAVLLFGDPRFCAIADGTPYERLMRDYHPDAILEGSGSFVARGAGPADLPPSELPLAELYRDFLPPDVVDRPDHRGWFVVVDGRGRVAWAYKEFPSPEWRGWHLLVLVARSTPSAYLGFLQRVGIPYLVCGAQRVDLSAALARLSEELGVGCVVATGGSRLNGALLREGLIDEIDLELVPALVGGETTPTLYGGAPLRKGEWPLRMERTVCDIGPDGRLHLHYLAAGPAGPPPDDAEMAAPGADREVVAEPLSAR